MGRSHHHRVSKKHPVKNDGAKKPEPKKKLQMKKAFIDDDDLFHPVKKGPKRTREDDKNNKENVGVKKLKLSDEEEVVKVEETVVEVQIEEPGTSKSIESAFDEFESPRKASRVPFCGIQPSFTTAYASYPIGSQEAYYLRSPDTTLLKKPLKRTISNNCIRQLAETDISPVKKLVPTPEEDEETEEGKEMAAFADETQKIANRLARKSNAPNFVRIDIRKKHYVHKSFNKPVKNRFKWKGRGGKR